MFQNIKKIEGGPFGTIKKFSKKSIRVPKKIPVKNTQVAKVGILSCFQGSGRRFYNFHYDAKQGTSCFSRIEENWLLRLPKCVF